MNPIAGIGGRVGLKGSDGLEIQRRARQLGAEPLAQDRTAAALQALRPRVGELTLMTGPGLMGESAVRRCGVAAHALSRVGHELWETPAEDTRSAAQAMRAAGAELILFAGGDGTARNIYEVLGSDFPVLGIPAGVKIYSGVFGITARNAGELALEFLTSRRSRLRQAEVLDLDEDAYRAGEIYTRLYGYLTIPYRRGHVQNQKTAAPASEYAQAQAIAADVVAGMAPEQAYLLGPGTTTRAVAELLGLPKTLVGMDIVTRDGVLAMDVSERQILEMLDQRPLKLVVTPIGGQGFLFGRGNQQISPDVIRRVGRENIMVISLPSKIIALRGRPLLVDTGETAVDQLLNGYVEVITGYHEKIVYKVSGGR